MREYYYNGRRMRVPGHAGWLAAAGAIGAALACGAPLPRPGILLVTIDTLRADRLGCYGYGRPTSPHIDRLAARGMLFAQARATVPRTTQSIASILTGRYPKGHGARGLFSVLPAANVTLAEILKGEGYATAAFVSNMFLRPGRGFEQGFEVYDNPPSRWEGNSAPAVTAAALAWLRALPPGRPWFLWAHYLDPHWTYRPPPEIEPLFAAAPWRPFTLYEDLERRRITKGQVIFENRLHADEVEYVRGLYDGEIAATDAALGPLLEAAAGAGALVVLTSDHGESLGEHGYHFAHGEYLYEPGLRIPLIVAHPARVPPGSRSDAAVLTVDVAPTILALAGIRGMQGVDGRPILVGPAGGPAAPAPGRDLVYAESDFQLIHPENRRYHVRGPAGRWTAVSDGRLKMIHVPRPGGEILEIYDLRDDPGETRNLEPGGVDPRDRARLLRALRTFADYDAGAGAVLPPLDRIDPEERERLRSLGYIN
jgi:arylsulfatase